MLGFNQIGEKIELAGISRWAWKNDLQCGHLGSLFRRDVLLTHISECSGWVLWPGEENECPPAEQVAMPASTEPPFCKATKKRRQQLSELTKSTAFYHQAQPEMPQDNFRPIILSYDLRLWSRVNLLIARACLLQIVYLSSLRMGWRQTYYSPPSSLPWTKASLIFCAVGTSLWDGLPRNIWRSLNACIEIYDMWYSGIFVKIQALLK